MGRPERPIDPTAGPIAGFAADLRKLREEAGRPSYRELARRASFSVTVLSEAAGGRCLPTLAVVRGYVRACGGDVGEWEKRWRHASDQRRDEPASAPYQGLASYGEEHAGSFFGRETLTEDLLQRLADRRFLAVFGASGSGKSSLLRAGVLAAINRGDRHDWVTIFFTPGEQPVTTLATRIAALAQMSAESLRDDLLTEPSVLCGAVTRGLRDRPAGAELLLVVDQFEELFSGCRDPLQRDCFVQALLAVIGTGDARTRVVLGVRADFYAHCARWPELVTALRDAQVLVGPMDLDQMRDVIVKPAEQAGMTVESALVATALAEIGTATGIEPGALALVSHALLETWRHSPPGRLTLRGYQEAGGVRNAVAATAERVYADCPESQRPVLRRIFLRLVAVGDGSPDTRRRVPPAELAAADDPAATAALAEVLARARLVTIDDGSVQLAHEALIRFWPRLAEWLAEGRDGLRVQRRLADAASEWARLGRDPAALYRGTPLAVTRAWADHDAGLTGLTSAEREFLDASEAAEAVSRTSVIRAARRLRRLVAALVVLLTAVTAAGAVAGWQRETALSAESAAVSGQLAAQSAALARVDPDASALAALAAWRARPTVTARSALLSLAACCTSTQTTLRGGASVAEVALSASGKLLASAGADGVVRVWQTADGRQQAALPVPGRAVDSVAVSPDGKILAGGSADGTIWLWNPASGAIVNVLAGGTDAIEDLAFSPDGRLLASVSGDGQTRLWHLAGSQPGQGTGAAQGQVLQRGGPPVRAVAFSPDGGLLAAAGNAGTVTIWSTGHPSVVRTLSGATTAIVNLAYSPAGNMVAAEESDGRVLLWQRNPRGPKSLPHGCTGAGAGNVSSGLAFSGDGAILLVAGGYGQLHLCATATGRHIANEPYQTPGRVTALAYEPGSGSLALGTRAGSVRYWQRPIPPFTAGPARGTRLAAVPGQRAVASVSKDGVLRLWNDNGTLTAATGLSARPRALAASPDGKLLAVAGPGRAITVFGLPHLTPVSRLWPPGPARSGPIPVISFSPDGRLVAESGGRTVLVWDATTGTLRLALRSGSQPGAIDAVGFGLGGRVLAASTGTGEVIEWDTRTGRQVAVGHQGPGPVNTLGFSPDGQLLATADGEGTVTLWDPARLRRVGTLLDGDRPVWSLAFSPDGAALASGTSDGSIMVWDTAHRTLTATLASQGTIRTLAFAPDGTTLMSAGTGITAWDLDPGDMARQACRTLAGDPGIGQAEKLVPGASYPRLCPLS